MLNIDHMNVMTNNTNEDNGVGSPPQVIMRSSLDSASSKMQSASVRRRSLNISHFNAVQSAVSQLARIDDFDLEELGYGFFSDVFKVTHKQTGKVMVLKRNKETNSKMNILREVQLMNRLSHPNILKFKGVCVHEGQLHGLTEFINGGDLEKLVTKRNLTLSWKQRIQIAYDISKGMKYLHAIGIFHRDLSAKNCLVSITTEKNGKKKYKAVVADLGLAEKIPTCPEDEKRFALVGTPYIMAPEVIHGRPYNEKADIFSYGLILCQLMALVSCDPEELPRRSDFGLAIDSFERVLTSKETSTPPPKELLQLAYDCCQLDPKARPTFPKIVTALEAILGALKKKKRASSFRVDDSARGRYSGSTTRSSHPSTSNGNPTVSPSKPPMSPRARRPSSASRLSRSFSDISRELLTHAANMALSANDDDDETSFANPFSALEHLDGGRAKLIDEPSLALLEMTFDIATTDYRKTSWVEETDGPSNKRGLKKRQSRPKSVFASFNDHPNANPEAPLPPTSLNISSPAHSVRHRSSDSAMSSPRSHCSTPDGHNQHDNEYKLAMHRAMILSPRGNNLASWWCARKRAEGDSGTAKERQSLASVISVLSRNVSSVRRSISLPDVSRISTLFKTHEPDKLKSSMTAAERKPRSRTDNEVFYGSSQEFSLSGANSLKSDFNRPSPKLVVSDHDSCGSGGGGHHVTFAPQEEAKIFFPNEEEKERLPSLQEQESDVVDPNPQSVSSSSSGCSSSGLLVCSAEMTQLRRKDSKDRAQRQDPVVTTSVVNHSCLRRNSSDRPHVSKTKNRDSGYEEDHHVHQPVSPVLESGNEHVVWSIQENESPSSYSGDCCADIPYTSCSGTVTDWNSNENKFHPSKHKMRSDAVL